MNEIGWAVKQMQDGMHVCRSGWNGKNMHLCLVRNWSQSEGYDLPLSPFVAMKTATNELVPWLCSQTDLLATDWQIAN